MPSPITPLLIIFAAMVLVMASAWVTQRVRHNAGWIDVFWTLGTGLACVSAALWPSDAGNTHRQILVAFLAGIWSLRLGLYVGLRVARSLHEDVRYATLREEWGANFSRRLFALALVQAPATTLLAWSVFSATHANTTGLGIRDACGALILLASIGGEALADEQMRRFKTTPGHGKINETGLWGWSRHPNYFFEWLGWVAYPVIGFSANDAASWATLIAPALMYAILRYGTGVPALEHNLLKSRGDAFRAYQSRVSAFIPRPPRSQP